MCASPEVPVKGTVQVADVCPVARGVFQVIEAVVVLPSAATSDGNVPVAFGALFQ
jgi:hypothetical protein